jgi:hypothetical protein
MVRSMGDGIMTGPAAPVVHGLRGPAPVASADIAPSCGDAKLAGY